MAEISTLARPYAKAAFQAADGSQSLDEWAGQLALLSAVSEDPRVAGILSAPALTAEQKSQQIQEICGDELGGAQRRFVAVVAENKRLGLLPEIARQFAELKARREKQVAVDVESAFELPAEVSDRLAQVLSKKFECDVRVQTSINRDLLGGVLIRAGDTVIDGSVRGRLEKLATAMNL